MPEPTEERRPKSDQDQPKARQPRPGAREMATKAAKLLRAAPASHTRPHAAQERERGLCVHCGGPWPVDALPESAAARLATRYRNEVQIAEEQFVRALVDARFEHEQAMRWLRRLVPRLIDATRVPAVRPALERELQAFDEKFLQTED